MRRVNLKLALQLLLFGAWLALVIIDVTGPKQCGAYDLYCERY